MLIKNDFLKITTSHQNEFTNFSNQMLLALKKYKLTFNYIKKTEKKIKSTILRSPHVNKTARDQIELYSVTYYFNLHNDLFKFFLFIFKKYIKFGLKCDFIKIKNERIFHIIKGRRFYFF